MQTHEAGTYFRQFNETIDQWILYLEEYTLEMLCRVPATGGWSLGQVYIHLIDDTGYHVEQMKAALMNNNANSDKTMHPDARALFARNAFPDTRIEGPSANVSIRQPASREELHQKLEGIKTEVNRLYHDFDFDAAKGKALHPGLHYFNAAEWLHFTEMHMRHHFSQKKRIDQALGCTGKKE
jgi:hypothetical protein